MQISKIENNSIYKLRWSRSVSIQRYSRGRL